MTTPSDRIQQQGLTYDDVLLVPQLSTVTSRKEVSTQTKISRNLTVAIPIVASNMDTVCEAQMAIAMAREGGIGILHRFANVEEQCNMVRTVKRAQSLLIDEPRSIAPTATRQEALDGLAWHGRKGGVASLMVVDENRVLLGVVTRSDLTFAPASAKVSEVMTPRARLVVTQKRDMPVLQAKEVMFANRIANLPVVGSDNKTLVGLVTAGDVRKLTQNVHASKDGRGQFLVGAAIGVKRGDLERAEKLVQAGADVLVVDIAHGHSNICIDMVRALKKSPITKNTDVIAGNIATAEGARDLIAAGADGLKVGVGPGSICITRIVAGAGVPQLTALMDVYSEARKHDVPVMADGGIKTSGDVSKAIAAGASCVMLGNTLAGTDESPGAVLLKDGKKCKIIRGMAGYGANMSKAEREKAFDEDVFLDMVPEGVEGSIPYKGPVAPILHQLVGGLRSGMSYCGSRTVREMNHKAKFVRMTGAGLRESGHHDISKL